MRTPTAPVKAPTSGHTWAAPDWITCPQRATADGGDFVVHGWADGILVRFTVRAGRVREWSLRRSTERTARPHLAGTPPTGRPMPAATPS